MNDNMDRTHKRAVAVCAGQGYGWEGPVEFSTQFLSLRSYACSHPVIDMNSWLFIGRQGCIFFKWAGEGFQYIIYAWRVKRRERGRKKGWGKEKGGDWKKREKRGVKRGKVGEKSERGRKKLRMEGKRIFSNVLGKVFNSVMCWKPSPAP